MVMKTFFGGRSRADRGDGAGNVIAMDRFRSGRTVSPLRQAEAYWSALRVGDGVPRRSDIDPRGLENILEYTFILERIAPGVARFRLAGSHLSEMAGMEVRGMPLTAFFTAAARSEIGATLEHVFDTPAICEMSLRAERRFTAPRVEARMILLPLQSDFGDVSRALGIMISDGPLGTGGRRFEISESVLRDLPEVAQPDAASAAPQAAGFAAPQADFVKGKPQLRLVSSEE
ncbi:hypothetical protein SPO1943 [Ruegeria pomeroyi DSS-3]|uniref:PAS domain-containing protein n=2 Tax=Ruegeria pomeroyi TaxID=89184 RepID=Q5LS27_RUEPO|nr:hypothetical protein SPO1943 [Ruegeria pomeroyi DSS-3]